MEQIIAGPLGLVLGLILLIWAVLMLSPFFWYGTSRRTREVSEKMDTLIELYRQVSTKTDMLVAIQRQARNLPEHDPKQAAAPSDPPLPSNFKVPVAW